jgi:hypothetical protein
MHAFEQMIGRKAARLLAPVTKPLGRKHSNIADLWLRRLTQQNAFGSQTSLLKSHWKIVESSVKQNFCDAQCERRRKVSIFAAIFCAITPQSQDPHEVLTLWLAQRDVPLRERN